jgi:hypothetical protein
MTRRKFDPLAQTHATGALGKRSVFLLVCRAVYASGGVGDEERQLIKKLQKVFRIPPDEANILLGRAKRGTKPSQSGLSGIEVFTRACRMAWSDGDLTKRERKILTALAAAMKLDKSDAERILGETYEAQSSQTLKTATDLVAEGMARPEAKPKGAPPPPPGSDSGPDAPADVAPEAPAEEEQPARDAQPPAAEADPPASRDLPPTRKTESPGHGAEPPSPEDAAPVQPPSRLPFLAGIAASLVVVGVACVGGGIWWVKERVAEVRKSGSLVEDVLPRQGPASDADAAFQEAMGAFMKLPNREGLWGFGWQEDVKPTPKPDAAKVAVSEAETLRRVMVERFGPAVEPDDHDVVLQKVHDFKQVRKLHNRLAEEFLSLLLLGRHDEAVALAEATERHSRILSRGIANHPNLIARMIGLSCTKTFDRAMLTAIDRKMIPFAHRSRLAAVLRESLEKNVPVEVSLKAEFEMARRAVRAFDHELGLLQYPMRLWWGDGLATIDDLERRLEQNRPVPGPEFFANVHVGVQIAVPNYTSARSHWKVAVATRKKILGALS